MIPRQYSELSVVNEYWTMYMPVERPLKTLKPFEICVIFFAAEVAAEEQFAGDTKMLAYLQSLCFFGFAS